MYFPMDLITISCCPIKLSTTIPANLSPLDTITTVRLSCCFSVLGTSSILSSLIRGITVPLKFMTSFECTYLISVLKTSSIVWILPKGIAYFSGPSSTISAWIIARVSGRRIIKLLPSPSFVFASISPPSASILVLTTSSPTPRPDTSDMISAVEKLGLNNRSMTSLSVIRSA